MILNQFFLVKNTNKRDINKTINSTVDTIVTVLITYKRHSSWVSILTFKNMPQFALFSDVRSVEKYLWTGCPDSQDLWGTKEFWVSYLAG